MLLLLLLLLLAGGDAGGQRQQQQGRDVEQRKEKVDRRQARKEEEAERESRDGRSWFVSCGLLALRLAVAGQIAAGRRTEGKKDGWSANRQTLNSAISN